MIPSTQQMLILPGWAISAESLMPLGERLVQLNSGLSIASCSFPLPATKEPDTMDDGLDRLGQHLGLAHPGTKESRPWLCGWSLGGMLAVALAQRFSARVAGVVTLAANTRFTATSDWPNAMPVTTFEAFRHAYHKHPEKTLKRFIQLCSQGCDTPLQCAKQLMQWVAQGKENPTFPAQGYGLEWLASLDNRQALATLGCPHLHVFAEHDALVPAAVQRDVDSLSRRYLHTHSISGSGHAFPIEKTEETAACIVEFIDSCSKPSQ